MFLARMRKSCTYLALFILILCHRRLIINYSYIPSPLTKIISCWNIFFINFSIDGTFSEQLGSFVNDGKGEGENCKMRLQVVGGRPYLCLFSIKMIQKGCELRYLLFPFYYFDTLTWKTFLFRCINLKNFLKIFLQIRRDFHPDILIKDILIKRKACITLNSLWD